MDMDSILGFFDAVRPWAEWAIRHAAFYVPLATGLMAFLDRPGAADAKKDGEGA